MKKTITIAVVTGIIIGLAGARLLIGETVPEPLPKPAAVMPALTHQQKAWLGALEWCESRGRPSAINPKDRDGTPSYGILEFKPSTFALFAGIYGTGSTTDYMNADEQEAIVTQMILKGGIDWAQQFPACTRLLGNPPQSTAATVRS